MKRGRQYRLLQAKINIPPLVFYLDAYKPKRQGFQALVGKGGL